MRILFVAFPISIHSTRWILQLADQGWELHFAPSVQQPMNEYLAGKVILQSSLIAHPQGAKRLAMDLLGNWPTSLWGQQRQRLLDHIQQKPSGHLLKQIIQRVKPDIIHSLETQSAGYQTFAAKALMGGNFPTWIHSTWGSDIYLYHRIAAHQERLTQVMENCDYLLTDCERDVDLAKQFRLKAQILPVLSAAGGMDVDQLQQFRQPGPVSQRKVILLKGYQHWAGRAFVGLRAIELCADVILEWGYTVLIYLASPDVVIAAEFVAQKTGVPIQVIPFDTYEDSLRRFGSARIHIGLNISDGAAQTIFESMVMGAFPIQSCTACVDEWIEDGKSGFIVPPEDPHRIAEALRRALTDDALIDEADQINNEIIRRRLDYSRVKEQVIELYKSIYTATRN